MKRDWRRSLAVRVGRVCGVVAVTCLLLYGATRWLVNVAIVSPDRHWLLLVREGTLITFHETDALYWIVDLSDPGGGQIGLDNLRGSHIPSPDSPWLKVCWFGPEYSVASVVGQGSMHEVPLWWMAVPFAAVAVFTEIRHRRRLKGERSGLCARCGYNRAGIAMDAVCPECGKRS